MRLPPVYMLTCPRRTQSAEATIQRWLDSDWSEAPHAIIDGEPEDAGEPWGSPSRSSRITGLFAALLAQVVDDGGPGEEWTLLIEDDIDVHPRIGTLVSTWDALRDPRCGLASLFNPSLGRVSYWGEMSRAFAADPKTFLGAQALLIRRGWAEDALSAWNSVPGMQAQRLAHLFGSKGPIWVHTPSLVQHIAEDSSWGARPQRALDFDKGFSA